MDKETDGKLLRTGHEPWSWYGDKRGEVSPIVETASWNPSFCTSYKILFYNVFFT